MIYDCFLFFNECDALEIRLHELAEVVDRFVLLECPRTFTGRSKPLYFSDNASRFSAFAEKIVHVVLEPSEAPDAWAREREYRNRVVEAAAAAQRDVLMLSDADEIPPAGDVRQLARSLGETELVEFSHLHHYYRLDMRNGGRASGTRLASGRVWSAGSACDTKRRAGSRVVEAGWHYSFLGGAEAMLAKLAAYSHTELYHPPYNTPEHVEGCRQTGEDLFGRGAPYRPVPVDETFPAWVRAHAEELRARGLLG